MNQQGNQNQNIQFNKVSDENQIRVEQQKNFYYVLLLVVYQQQLA